MGEAKEQDAGSRLVEREGECLTSCFEADLDGQVIPTLLSATGQAIKIA